MEETIVLSKAATMCSSTLRILALEGPGISKDGIHAYIKSVIKHADSKMLNVTIVSTPDPKSTDWDIITIMGGTAVKIIKNMKNSAADAIMKHFHKGGTFFGICAGAYFYGGVYKIDGTPIAGIEYFSIAREYKKLTQRSPPNIKCMMTLKIVDKKLAKKWKQVDVRYHNGAIFDVQTSYETSDYSVHPIAKIIDIYDFAVDMPEEKISNLKAIMLGKTAIVKTVHKKSGSKFILCGPHPEGNDNLNDFIYSIQRI